MRLFASPLAAVILLGWGTTVGVSPAIADTATPYIDLNVLSGVEGSQALDVNNHGLVIGTSSRGPSTWDRAGRLTVLRALADSIDTPTLKAVNDRDQIIGHTTTADGRDHAIRWNRDGSITDLEFPPGKPHLWSVAINNAGTVIGIAAEISFPLGQAVRWDQAGQVSELPELPGPVALKRSWATAINDHGTIIGAGNDPFFSVFPGYWDRAGVSHSLAPPPGVSVGGLVTDVNNRGFIVGVRGIVWDPAGRGSLLPGDNSSALQINERNTILGSATFADSGTTAARWRDGRISQLTLPPTGQSAYAIEENNDDITIGRAILSPHQEVPVWWDRSGAVHRLACPSSQWGSSCVVNAINDQGIAVGSGTVDTGTGGLPHALMWKLR